MKGLTKKNCATLKAIGDKVNSDYFNIVFPATAITNSIGVELVYPNTTYGNIKEEKKGMRALFRVVVVNPKKNGKVLLDETVIVKDEKEAGFKANIGVAVKSANLEYEDVDIHIEAITPHFIRAKEKPKKVRVIEKDED